MGMTAGCPVFPLVFSIIYIGFALCIYVLLAFLAGFRGIVDLIMFMNKNRRGL